VNRNHLQDYIKSVDLTNFPRGFMTWFNQAKKDTPEKIEQWYKDRYECLCDPIALGGYAPVTQTDPDAPEEWVPILGMDFQENPHRLLFSQFVQTKPGEGVVLSNLDTTVKKRMILWQRGVFKTSAVRVDIVQKILNYPNIRICFLTGGDQLAKRQLATIKQFFEKPTPRFKFLFPEFCLKSVQTKKAIGIDSDGEPVRAWEDRLCKMGTAHEFTVPARTNTTFPEPTFAISTAKSVKAGSHYDIIYIDDLVNETNYRSVPALEKCYQDYIDICPLLTVTGYMILTGTRYSFGDTYERIQELAKQEETETGKTIWKFSIRDCWSLGCANCSHTDVYHDRGINILEPPCTVEGCKCIGFAPNGVKGVLFPEAITHDGNPIGDTVESLEAKRRELGAEFFANQYENNPIASGTQTFTQEIIDVQTLHHLSQFPQPNQSFVFAVGDLAYVGEEGRDFSVIYLCRLFQGQIFVYDCMFGNWDSGKVSDITMDILLKHRPNIIYYEKFNGWESYNNNITAKAAAMGIQKVPIEWVKISHVKNAKLIRIGSIKGVLTNHRLWLYAGMLGFAKLVQQLLKWPKLGRHDDFGDCLGQVVAAPTGYQLTVPPTQVAVSNWLRKLNQAAPVDDSYTDNGCGTGIIC
jgi:hypothetical protein